MSPDSTDGRPLPAPRPVRRHRVVVTLGVLVTLALTVTGVFWAHAATTAATPQNPVSRALAGATDQITRGDLEGATTVSGTLTFSGRHTVQSGREGTVTALPEPGQVLTQGDALYAVDNVPSFLLHGAMPAWRDFGSGMEDGPDVKQLEQSLRDLGHFEDEPDERFRWATAEGIRRWQKANDQPETGELPLGTVVFSSGDLRVGPVSAGVGARLLQGAALYDATDTTQVVEINLKLADQQVARLGGAVTVRLPGGTSTSGAIRRISTPTEVDGANGQKQLVIPVIVSLDNSADAAPFQQASVTVDLPSERREDVLSVPVGALLAITPSQLGVEVVEDDGTTTTVPVTTGLFAGGRVEISGDDLEAGQRVVVPQR